MKKSISIFAVSSVLISFLFGSCSASRFGNGCPDARRAIGYGCYRGK